MEINTNSKRELQSNYDSTFLNHSNNNQYQEALPSTDRILLYNNLSTSKPQNKDDLNNKLITNTGELSLSNSDYNKIKNKNHKKLYLNLDKIKANNNEVNLTNSINNNAKNEIDNENSNNILIEKTNYLDLDRKINIRNPNNINKSDSFSYSRNENNSYTDYHDEDYNKNSNINRKTEMNIAKQSVNSQENYTQKSKYSKLIHYDNSATERKINITIDNNKKDYDNSKENFIKPTTLLAPRNKENKKFKIEGLNKYEEETSK